MSAFALVDCNSFYASCEKVFVPEIWYEPVVVLSNNDGNIVARSKEAKTLGIGMGAPFFEERSKIVENHVRVFSSNYAFYGSMSNRFRAVLGRFTPRVEYYSIDECFLDLSGFDPKTLTGLGHRIKATVERAIRVPVCVGLAETKSLAKVANKVAKKSDKDAGVVNFIGSPDTDKALASLPVGDIWGIGSQHEEFFLDIGVKTALDFKNCLPTIIRKRMGVVGARMQMEFHRVSCLPLEELPAPKKRIGSSKGFSHLVDSKEVLHQAITNFATRTAEKVRKQKQAVAFMSVDVATDPFREDLKQYHKAWYYSFPEPTAYTPRLVAAANECIDKIYKPGFLYKRVGIEYIELVDEKFIQQSLLERINAPREKALMLALDKVNQKYGRGTLRMATEGYANDWKTRFQFKSQNFMDWDEFPIVKAS